MLLTYYSGKKKKGKRNSSVNGTNSWKNNINAGPHLTVCRCFLSNSIILFLRTVVSHVMSHVTSKNVLIHYTTIAYQISLILYVTWMLNHLMWFLESWISIVIIMYRIRLWFHILHLLDTLRNSFLDSFEYE